MNNLMINTQPSERKSNDGIIYSKVLPIGQLKLRHLNIKEDLPIIYDWVTREYARYWGMNDKSYEEVKAEYLHITTSQYSEAFIGLVDNDVAFLCETYDPSRDPVGAHYVVRPGDRGMHLLVGPPAKQVREFTWHVFTVAMDFLFSDNGVNRVVVEPDVNNNKIHRLNKRAGFKYEKVINLLDKTAHLAFCTRSQYEAALQAENFAHTAKLSSANYCYPEEAVAHLEPELWAKANRIHLTKAISEFAHECLIHPELQYQESEWEHHHLSPANHPDVIYMFRVQKLSLDHWYIDRESLKKIDGGEEKPLDSLKFILEFKSELGIKEQQLPGYLEEISSTLYGSTYMLANNHLTARQLVGADYQAFEHAMTTGHPCFVANNGRIGFDAVDYRRYAPEAGQPVRLLWLAGHKSRTAYNAIDTLPYEMLREEELGADTIRSFNSMLEEKGLQAQEYYFIPVHPWQWYNKLAMLCAPDIAANHLVCLGYSPDDYNAQQSIRTFYNISRPEKFYTKTALSVLNMGFVRGLSPYYMDSTPAITSWIKKTIGEDPYLKEVGFTLLCEVATVGYRNFYYEGFGKSCAYNKMLAGLWRESPATVVKKGQQLMTMAALLHRDCHGAALLPELIIASGKDTTTWLQEYLRCYLTPLLHCFYQHELVFMPHGENLILVMENHVPVKAIMKDIAEEIVLFKDDASLPERAKRICMEVPEEVKLLSIFTDVFDCFFRFLVEILNEHCNYSDKRFWQLVAACIRQYQHENPHLRDKFDRYDLFAPEFALSCLNRLQLQNHKQMVDLSDPAGSLQLVGTLSNPIAPFKSEFSNQHTRKGAQT